MSTHSNPFSVFTKPWHTPLPELAVFVKSLGFDGIELPVRPGYQVPPENVSKGLPEAVRILGDYGLIIYSIAGPTDEATIAACAEQGIPIIRVMADIGDQGYMAAVQKYWREFDLLLPLLERYGVKVGVQNHCGKMICNAMGLLHLLERYDPSRIGAIWDAAHNALQGEEPEMAIDIIWSHLLMVNLKNAVWRNLSGPEAEGAEWGIRWTAGRYGLASWRRVADELKKRQYEGVVCLTAEYSDAKSVDRLISEDILFAKGLFMGRCEDG